MTSQTVKLALVVMVSAVLGLMAGILAPTAIGSGTDRVLSIASLLALSGLVGLAIPARRLRRHDVPRFERWLRSLFFARRT